MKRLLKLEIEKFKLSKYVKVFFIVVICILAFISISIVDSLTDPEQMRDTYESTLRMINLLVTGSFLIFSSVLTVKLVISEYRKRTILILFSYPIKRERIMGAKMILVCGFTIIGIAIGYICCLNYIFILEYFFDVLEDGLSLSRYFDGLKNLVQECIIGGVLSMIPFAVGMIKKSGSAAIVSAVLTVCLMQPIMGRNPSFPEFMLKMGIALIIVLAFVGYTLKVKIHTLDQIYD